MTGLLIVIVSTGCLIITGCVYMTGCSIIVTLRLFDCYLRLFDCYLSVKIDYLSVKIEVEVWDTGLDIWGKNMYRFIRYTQRLFDYRYTQAVRYLHSGCLIITGCSIFTLRLLDCCRLFDYYTQAVRFLHTGCSIITSSLTCLLRLSWILTIGARSDFTRRTSTCYWRWVISFLSLCLSLFLPLSPDGG